MWPWLGSAQVIKLGIMKQDVLLAFCGHTEAACPFMSGFNVLWPRSNISLLQLQLIIVKMLHTLWPLIICCIQKAWCALW